MVKTIQEQIEVMQHYANGDEIERLITEDGYSEWDGSDYQKVICVN